MTASPKGKPSPAPSLALFDDVQSPQAQGSPERPGQVSRASPAIRDKSHQRAPKEATTKVAAATRQAYLPGLSRRGRPRSANPMTAVQRTAEHRKKRLAEGARRVEMILDPDVAKSLDLLAAHYNEPRSDVVAMLIRKAAGRILARDRASVSTAQAS